MVKRCCRFMCGALNVQSPAISEAQAFVEARMHELNLAEIETVSGGDMRGGTGPFGLPLLDKSDGGCVVELVSHSSGPYGTLSTTVTCYTGQSSYGGGESSGAAGEMGHGEGGVDPDGFWNCYGDRVFESVMFGMAFGAVGGFFLGATTAPVTGPGAGVLALGGAVAGSLAGGLEGVGNTAIQCFVSN